MVVAATVGETVVGAAAAGLTPKPKSKAPNCSSKEPKPLFPPGISTAEEGIFVEGGGTRLFATFTLWDGPPILKPNEMESLPFPEWESSRSAMDPARGGVTTDARVESDEKASRFPPLPTPPPTTPTADLICSDAC